MNKTFLLVASVFAYLSAVILFLVGLLYFNLTDILLSTTEGVMLTQEEIEMLEMLSGAFQTLSIVFFVFAALNIVAGVRINMARNEKASSKEALGWGIMLLFTSGLIGGIFGILGATSKNSNQEAGKSSLEAQLKELDDLYHKGMLTKEEYMTRRDNLIQKV